MGDPAFRIPGTLQTISDAAGVEAALKLALECGGTRQRIPLVAEGSKLAEYVGIDAARRIVEALADERLTIPHARKPMAIWLRSQGWSQERVARELKVERRTVQLWEKRAALNPPQADLFG
jgi:hypothetical protein